jgi:hypothetical protein
MASAHSHLCLKSLGGLGALVWKVNRQDAKGAKTDKSEEVINWTESAVLNFILNALVFLAPWRLGI